MTERILKSIWLHPFRWLAGGLLVIVSMFVICSGNESSRPVIKNQPTQKSVSPTEKNLLEDLESSAVPDRPQPDPQPTQPEQVVGSELDPVDGDETDAEMAQARKISAERAALPFLPLKTRNVTAEYKDQLSNGDLVIEVGFRGSKAEAIREWQKFLDKYQDPGTAYLVIYKPK